MMAEAPAKPARRPARRARVLARTAAGLLLSAITNLMAVGLTQSQPTVVVSIHPIFDLVRQVAGADATVARLLPPGGSAHTFDPTPRDVLRVAQADLLFLNGGLDLWLRGLVEASGNDAPVVEIISLASVRAVLLERFPDLVTVDVGGAAGGSTALGFNSHVWLDPLMMAAALPDIATALAGIDPDSADGYAARAEALALELVALDAELSETLAPIEGAAFVPFHDAWPYFAARYGLDLIVEIEPYPGREPSPAYLRRAIELVRASGATAIFTETQLNRRPAEVLAAEAGVELYELDPKGGFPGRESYQELLRYNAGVMLEALR